MARTAVKTGRNDPCPCGSGRKYKQCCLAKDKDDERATARGVPEKMKDPRLSGPPVFPGPGPGPGFVSLDDFFEDEDTPDAACKAVVDLIRAGKLDEGERAAHQLLKDHPYIHDGFDYLGMVEEARGNSRAAADWYRKALAFLRDNSGAEELMQVFRDKIARLDPDGPAS